jgi:hypothetical protein
MIAFFVRFFLNDRIYCIFLGTEGVDIQWWVTTIAIINTKHRFFFTEVYIKRGTRSSKCKLLSDLVVLNQQGYPSIIEGRLTGSVSFFREGSVSWWLLCVEWHRGTFSSRRPLASLLCWQRHQKLRTTTSLLYFYGSNFIPNWNKTKWVS